MMMNSALNVTTSKTCEGETMDPEEINREISAKMEWILVLQFFQTLMMVLIFIAVATA